MARDRRRRSREKTFDKERWLISYSDFITLLFAFFVVMYSISSVNAGKFRVLSQSLENAFQVVPHSMKPIQVGKVEATAPSVDLFKSFPSPIRISNSLRSKAYSSKRIVPKNMPHHAVNLTKIGTRLEKRLAPLVKRHELAIMLHKHWIDIRLGTDFLFPSGSIKLSRHALTVIHHLAAALKALPIQVQVQGFTDNVPIHSPVFPSNWELSAARAASVVRVMAQDGMPPNRLAAVGFGQYHPIASNALARGRLLNRRVDLVILPENSNISTKGMPDLLNRLKSNRLINHGGS